MLYGDGLKMSNEDLGKLLVQAVEYARDQELTGKHDWCDDQIILDVLECAREKGWQ